MDDRRQGLDIRYTIKCMYSYLSQEVMSSSVVIKLKRAIPSNIRLTIECLIVLCGNDVPINVSAIPYLWQLTSSLSPAPGC